MKILIIEDEKVLSDSILSYMKAEKYLCEQAFDYKAEKLTGGRDNSICKELSRRQDKGTGDRS